MEKFIKFDGDVDNLYCDAENLYCDANGSFSFAQHERALIAANCSEYAVAHSNVRLQPARQLNEAGFLPNILSRLHGLRLTRLQSYAWPHLNRGLGHGALIVSGARSGRTVSYALPLCQAVCKTLAEYHSSGQSWRLQGPIGLVLVPDLRRVHEIAGLCSVLLRDSGKVECQTLVLTVPSARKPEFFQRILDGVGCLVATPAQFIWLCGHSIKFSDFRFVAYDDVDLLTPEKLLEVHQHVLGLAKKQRPQLAIISQSFKPKLLSIVREFNSQAIVVFGDLLEAAVYGGVRVCISLQQRKTKCEEIIRILRQRPPHLRRTVVNCQCDSDIRELVEALEAHGYRCLPYYQSADMAVRDQVHRWRQQSRGELLICTDYCPELDVRDAQTLLHYSLSDNWSLFKLRHLALADNLRNHLASAQTGQSFEQDGLLSLVLVDENNTNQLPRLVDFLQMHQPVDERLLELACNIRYKIKHSKTKDLALCDQLLSLGNCLDPTCEQRHQLNSQDFSFPNSITTSGVVKLQLIQVYTPSHYCVRLLEHKPIDGDWRSLPSRVTLEVQLQLLQSQQCERLWPPLINQVCVYRNHSSYERVRILHVARIEHLNISRIDLPVKVQALDLNTRRFMTTSGKLYRCPVQLQDALPLAMDLRILGLLPHTGELSWNDSDGQQCANWLEAVPKPKFLQASIVTALSHTLFVKDLAVTSYAPSLQLHVRRLTMCRQLLHTKLAKKCEKTMAKVLQFVEKPRCEAVDVPKEDEKPPTAPLPGKSAILAKMAKQLGKENRLLLEREQKQQQGGEKSESDEDEEQREEQDQATKTEEDRNGENNFEALYKCLMKCTLMELSDKNNNYEFLTDNCEQVTDALLSEIQPECELPLSESKHLETKNNSTKSQFCEKVLNIHLQIPTNVRRPEVIYYQTLYSLELQIILPDEKLGYEAALHNGSCITFWTLSTPDTIAYQFLLNTHCPYQQLSHRQQGRTVYVSVRKSLAVAYPLDFGFYKFMKPHHEKLHQQEIKRRNRIADFEKYLLRHSYVKKGDLKCSENAEEQSSDEQEDCLAGDPYTERVEKKSTEYNFT